MVPHQTVTLSKSRFSAGLQCLKRLYFEVHQPELAEEPGAGQRALFDTGTKIGVLARKLFPAGRLIEDAYDRHDRAVAATAQALSDPATSVIFEAAFTFEGIRIRCDILTRNNDGAFDLTEVKSSSRVKNEYIPDTAIQLYVLEGLGLRLHSVFVVHINAAYVYQGGDYDLGSLFQREDVTGAARSFLAHDAHDKLIAMWEALRREQPPVIGIGDHCEKPYPCPFYGYCHQDLPEHYIGQLPNARAELLESLSSAGFLDIRQIPSDFPHLTSMQRRVRDSVLSGIPFLGDSLSKALEQMQPPLYFLDFEAINPALPLFPGTHPFQPVPFQWSLHLMDGQGTLRHAAYLHAGPDDPRQPLTEALLKAIDGEGPVVVYANFEAARLNDLAEYLPSYANEITALRRRLLDLLKLLREHYYHPAQHGSYSLKSVLPALAPDLDYNDLSIRDGSYAAKVYETILAPETSEEERGRLRHALLDYCQRDTLAMVKVVQVLRRELSQSPG